MHPLLRATAALFTAPFIIFDSNAPAHAQGNTGGAKYHDFELSEK